MHGPARRAALAIFATCASLAPAGCSSKGEGDKPTATSGKPAEPPRPPVSVTDLPGVDVKSLDDDKRRTLGELIDKYPSPCGKAHSLLTSLRSDPACKRSVFAARYLVRLLDAGLSKNEAEDAYEKRFVSPEMANCDLSNAPVRGNPSAPVTLCEFYDFQCPHCRMLEPILERLIDESQGQVKLYSKSFPLTSIHPDSRDGAAAAVAAGRQGVAKFWAMHDRLFAHQDHMTAADLEGYAADLKLDVKKWKADLPGAYADVDRDRAEAGRLGLTGTPSLYIDGRKYAGPMLYEEVKDWVDEELAR
jgi:predicted DsbA family dithiol-disulfide isomerase